MIAWLAVGIIVLLLVHLALPDHPDDADCCCHRHRRHR